MKSRVLELEKCFSNSKEKVFRIQGEKNACERDLRKRTKEKEDLNLKVEKIDKAGIILKGLSENLMRKNLDKIEDLVSWGLKSVFKDRDLKVKLEYVEERGVSGVEIITIEDGEISGKVLDTFGGGVVQVESFLFRVIFLFSGMKKVLFLDESFSNVSQEYLGDLSKFLKELCEKLGLRVLLVTHQEQLAESADRVYEGSKVDDNFKIERLR